MELIIRRLGRQSYQPVFDAMQRFTDQRTDDTIDELWLVEHDPVFTQGMNGKAEHLLAPGNIPVVQVDRGGQVTYHGPGQVVIYLLINVRRQKGGIRALIDAIEQSIIQLLAAFDINAEVRSGAPGVYVGQCKVGSLGLRVRRGCSYHGLSLNVDMDLSPFQRINPCGFTGLQMTQLRDLGIPVSMDQAGEDLLVRLAHNLDYDQLDYRQGEIIKIP